MYVAISLKCIYNTKIIRVNHLSLARSLTTGLTVADMVYPYHPIISFITNPLLYMTLLGLIFNLTIIRMSECSYIMYTIRLFHSCIVEGTGTLNAVEHLKGRLQY